MSPVVLKVDDDPDVRKLLEVAFDGTRYKVLFAADGGEAVKVFFQERPDLVILDVMLPVVDGWGVLQRIREMANTPVMMLTALGQVSDRVRGLTAGADDYLPKPFSPEEFLARCEALLRRSGEKSEEVQTTYGDSVVQVDLQHHQVNVDGLEVPLSPTEFRLLWTLVRNAGIVLQPDDLIDIVWG